MIIASMLGGLTGAVTFVLIGLWYGVSLPGLMSLYIIGGALSFVITLLVAMRTQGILTDPFLFP